MVNARIKCDTKTVGEIEVFAQCCQFCPRILDSNASGPKKLSGNTVPKLSQLKFAFTGLNDESN